MILEFPSSPAAYEVFLKAMAETHLNIEHSDSKPVRFAVVNEIPVRPWGTPDFTDFFAKQRSTFDYGSSGQGRKFVMVLLEMASDFSMETDRPYEIIDGSFMLLSPIKNNDMESKREIKDLAHTTGIEIMAWMAKYFELNSRYGNMEESSCEPIGIINPDKLTGYRFDFKYRVWKAGLCDYDKFSGQEPERIP